MDKKNIIIILLIIVILLLIRSVVEVFVFNNGNIIPFTSNITLSIDVAHISSDNNQNSIDANRPKNNPNYKGYTLRHESEITSDGWNPKEHEKPIVKVSGEEKKKYTTMTVILQL